ncbi:Hypothetical protein A7982_06893 [Minicystis rosea]|nr:Hypothetical protein A7982_06893 [Minicystis rosea]
MSTAASEWPALPLRAWKDTRDTLHLYSQIIGKIRLAQSPLMNEWWQVPLYLTARGLGTSPMGHDDRSFDIELDFIDHRVVIRASDGQTRTLPLAPRAVADFYAEVQRVLGEMGLDVAIHDKPVELPNPIPFTQDHAHAAYDAEYARRHWEILRRLDLVLKQFRARFTGKASPVHFFWGSFDLAVSRFSGRPAPPRPGADRITRVAYDEEVSSVGFWPGGMGVDGPALYSYMAPEPAGFAEQKVEPAEAFYSPTLREFVLMYDVVRASKDPTATVLAFAQSTYEAGARLAKWDRAALERPIERLLAA